MRLLFVIQRYGVDVAGGAETAARAYAERLAERGHDVEVLTSTALSYVTWANHFEPGTSEADGVVVHRLPVTTAREDEYFGPLNARVAVGDPPVPLHLQRTWMDGQGPVLEGFQEWLWERGPAYDAVVFCTYLYWPALAGLPVLAGRVPTVLMPFAHDEPYIRLPIFDTVFRLPDAFGFLTREEGDLVHRRFGVHRPSAVVGLGLDLAPPVADGAEIRERFGLGDRPYLLALGRVDPAKGLTELFDYFAAYKQRNPGDLALVVMGDPVRPLPEHPDVIPTGWVDEAVKHGALAQSLALVHPSYFESFSIVLCEAWVQRRPALVQGHCAVLDGQARRSGGAAPYRSFGQFEVAVDLLQSDPTLGDWMGRAGRRYVERRYEWHVVLERFERLLRVVAPHVRIGSR